QGRHRPRPRAGQGAQHPAWRRCDAGIGARRGHDRAHPASLRRGRRKRRARGGEGSQDHSVPRGLIHKAWTARIFLYTGAMTPRLKAGIFVRALIRRAEVEGAQAFVAKKGVEESGAVFLKLNRLDGHVLVLSQARCGEGDLVWARPQRAWLSTRTCPSRRLSLRNTAPDSSTPFLATKACAPSTSARRMRARTKIPALRRGVMAPV